MVHLLLTANRSRAHGLVLVGDWLSVKDEPKKMDESIKMNKVKVFKFRALDPLHVYEGSLSFQKKKPVFRNP